MTWFSPILYLDPFYIKNQFATGLEAQALRSPGHLTPGSSIKKKNRHYLLFNQSSVLSDGLIIFNVFMYLSYLEVCKMSSLVITHYTYSASLLLYVIYYYPLILLLMHVETHTGLRKKNYKWKIQLHR